MDNLKSKIIIHNYTELPDFVVVQYINKVIQNGKISKTSKGKQYCFVTRVLNDYIITSDRNKDTYTFKIYKERN